MNNVVNMLQLLSFVRLARALGSGSFEHMKHQKYTVPAPKFEIWCQLPTQRANPALGLYRTLTTHSVYNLCYILQWPSFYEKSILNFLNSCRHSTIVSEWLQIKNVLQSNVNACLNHPCVGKKVLRPY